MSSNVEYVFKKSTELSPEEKDQWLALFSAVFGKTRTTADFDRIFLQAPLGYSYHTLLLRDSLIVGAFNAIPYRYTYFGRETMIALSVDTMIHPDCRDNPFHMKKMAQNAHQKMALDGIPAVIGFPNHNYYEYEKRVVRSRDIGKLDFYVLPLRLGNVLGRCRRLLNILWLPVLWLILSIRTQVTKVCDSPIAKVDDDQFRRQRYTDDHKILALSGGAECVSRCYVEKNGSTAAYILDVTPMSPANLSAAVRAVRREYREADIIIYVGHLDFRPCNLSRLPEKLHPQQINMTGKLLQEGVLDERFFKLENWQINIANFDVR